MFKHPKLLITSLILIVFGVAILFANSTSRTERLADELVETTAVTPENEGKLVIVSGVPQLKDGGVIVDEEAGLQVENAVYYSRLPLQKVYVEKTRTVVIDKGEDLQSTVDDKTEIEHYVVQEWIPASSDRSDSITISGVRYENPAPINLGAYHDSGDLRLGEFSVSAADVADSLTTTQRWFTPEELQQSCKHYITTSELGLQAVADDKGRGLLATGGEIGDVNVLISYDTLEGAEAVTVVGRQRGDKLVLEDDELVDESERVQAGMVSKEDYLASATSEDASSRWYGVGALALGLVVLVLAVIL